MLQRYFALARSAAQGTMMAQENAIEKLLIAALNAYRVNASCLEDEEVDAMADFIKDLGEINPSLDTSTWSNIVFNLMERNYFTRRYFMTLVREKKSGQTAGYEKLLRRVSERASVTGCW